MLHTEIQTSATCLIGCETHHVQVESRLLAAAERAGLQEPFVHVVELGDYSVSYRVAGLLTEIKQLLSARSRLRVAMLHSLHEVGIEIMSPIFQAHRPVPDDARMIPIAQVDLIVEAAASRPEEIAFDKAEAAEEVGARSVLESCIAHARAQHLLNRVGQTTPEGT